MQNNILHVGKFYSPYSGGMETIIKDLCEGSAEKGHNIRVICSNDSFKFQRDTINNVDIFRYPLWAKFSSQIINPGLLISIIKHSRWADIIHIHSPNPLAELAVTLLKGKTKAVSTHHSDIYRQKLLKRLYSPLWKFFLSRLSKIIVPTENHIKFSDMICNQRHKTQIIPFGIKYEVSTLPENDSLIQKTYGKYLLFVGRLVDYKGIKYLIEALKEIDVNLVIIGGGPLQKSLQEQALRHEHLKKRVHILGRVESLEKLKSFYKNAYTFVLPSISKNENFGIVQLEAMAFSLPIITTNIKSGVPAVGIPNKTTLIVTPESSQELATAIQKMLDDEQLAKNFGEAGEKLFHKQYTYDKMITGHLDLYQKILNGK